MRGKLESILVKVAVYLMIVLLFGVLALIIDGGIYALIQAL